MKDLKLASTEESLEIWDQVDTWSKECNGTAMFEDTKSITFRSVGEYIANQKGLTLFKNKVTK